MTSRFQISQINNHQLFLEILRALHNKILSLTIYGCGSVAAELSF